MSGIESMVATPDFYDYAWIAADTVSVDGRFVTITWSDGATLRAYDLWLLENAVGLGTDRATREGLMDPAEHGQHQVASAEIAPDGRLLVDFDPPLEQASFHPGWLHHVATGQHLASSWLPPQRSWQSGDLAEPPTHEALAVLDETEALRLWLNDLVAYGIARLRGLPDDSDIALRVADRIGAVRDTNFGPIWDVKADVELAGNADTNSTANTNLRLGPHTDLPTRETPPGYQFLHCLANEAAGGHSTMADGVAVVAALQAEHPEHYEALTTLKWIFFNRGPGIDHRWSGPFIDLGIEGAPLTLRAFYPVRAFPDMEPVDMPRAYAAMKCFSSMAASDRFRMAYPFVPGDMVGFDNRRILHGRDPFESGGYRHLRGVYIDHDEVLSATRVANRHAQTQPSSKETSHG